MDSCILFAPDFDQVDFTTAVDRCRQLSSRLFEPRNLWLNNLVFQLRADLSKTSEKFWIGINDSDQEGRYVFNSSGEEISFTNWYRTEPNGRTSENYVAFYYNSPAQWIDLGPHWTISFICEIPLEP